MAKIEAYKCETCRCIMEYDDTRLRMVSGVIFHTQGATKRRLINGEEIEAHYCVECLINKIKNEPVKRGTK